uniref:Uncharacterized protein n=1 Tax=Anguilla anguilla TaxID=7936 RepID=A0A0E9TT74_ANGAN
MFIFLPFYSWYGSTKYYSFTNVTISK